MKQITIGMLAHVDAGKTTLSEAMLYTSGCIRKLGRVDNRDAFLDTYELERARGITIFSKQARMKLGEWEITLLDTPGHVDFSAEMERTLQVLDYAILIISGADGVQGHTRTLWELLRKYRIPTVLFVNKMDQEGTDPEKLLSNIKASLHENCVDFTNWQKDEKAFLENLAMCEEESLEQFINTGTLSKETMRRMIAERKTFPVFFGSALKLTGIEEFLQALSELLLIPGKRGATTDETAFGARVFKITRDEQGNRLTHLKVTSGQLKVKSVLPGSEEKINQIRLYSGARFDVVSQVEAGTVCAVTGPELTRPGRGIGCEEGSTIPLLEPVLNYRILLPEGMDAAQMLPKLRQLEEEIPELHLVWNEELQEIQAQVMGQVQMEILQSLILARFGVQVDFDEGNIVYKETIAYPVEGVGHYEPLRHYAEVHLLLEPLESGGGMQFETAVSEDVLDRNWQRLILTHLREKEHRGVLTGSPITDMKITLVAGRAHLKHTEGGDFRQATYRAVRQGLMQAETVLLEPVYEFRLEVPDGVLGRAMSDLERKNAEFSIEQAGQGMSVLTGKLPAACVKNYQKEVHAYTKGHGQFSYVLKGYEPCHNTEEVILQRSYDADGDLENPASSVFCAHGAGFVVPWEEVPDYMHLPFVYGSKETGSDLAFDEFVVRTGRERSTPWVGTEEIDAILEKTYYANRRKEEPRYGYRKKRTGKPESQAPVTVTYKRRDPKEEYLLVDGYNVIFAWEELRELAEVNIDSARGKLQDILCNYQAIRGCQLILVFDAYRVQGHDTELMDYHNIHVVFTKEAETADQYIEKFAHENGRKYRVLVATSDGLEQIIIRGQGCELISARELEQEVKQCGERIHREYMEAQPRGAGYLLDGISLEVQREVERIGKTEKETEKETGLY